MSQDPQPSQSLQTQQVQYPVNLDVYDADGKFSTGTHGILTEQELLQELELYRQGYDQATSGASIVLTDASGTTIQATKKGS